MIHVVRLAADLLILGAWIVFTLSRVRRFDADSMKPRRVLIFNPRPAVENRTLTRESILTSHVVFAAFVLIVALAIHH